MLGGKYGRLVDILLVQRGIVQNTAMYSELYLPVCKSRPIAHMVTAQLSIGLLRWC